MSKSSSLLLGSLGGLILLANCERQPTLDPVSIQKILTHRSLGLAYLEESKLKEAEKEFSELIELAPKEVLGYANLGLVYLRMGKIDEAFRQVGMALRRERNNPDIRLILAEVYDLSGDDEKALSVLEKTLERSPQHAKSHYKASQLYLRFADSESRWRAMEEHLGKVVELIPGNIMARLQLMEALLRRGKSEYAATHMEKIRRQVPDPPENVVEFYGRALQFMQDQKSQEALAPAIAVHNLLKQIPLYRAGVIELKGPGGGFTGFPIVVFSSAISKEMQKEQTLLAVIRFTDVSSSVGLDRVIQEEVGTNLAIGDYDSDGDPDLYVARYDPTKVEGGNFLFRNDGGEFVEIASEAGVSDAGKSLGATFADYDNDGRLDLYVVNDGANILYRNTGDGTFRDVTESAGVGDTSVSYGALFVDLDHEGDLDLFVANTSLNRLFRNNLDGSFVEVAEKIGLAGETVRSREAAFGDFDEDGDIDLFVVNENGDNRLYTNLRQGYFEDITAECGLLTQGRSGAAAVGDYDHDGFLDLFVTALENGRCNLYLNNGDGTFKPDTRGRILQETLQDVIGLDAAFFDLDNDGFLDLLVAGKVSLDTIRSRGVFLFRNDGTGQFKDVSSILPGDLSSAQRVAIADYDGDGDQDIFLADLGGEVRLLRNDGGNANRWLKVKLVGLSTESGKINLDGIGAKLEVKSGNLYQMAVVTEPVSHFGLGSRSKAEVVRVVWTNGVPQNRFDLESDQTIIEKQVLKGSCPFLYAWNGQEYIFVTDILWRSALGMPLGIMAGGTTYSFPNSAKEYIKVSGKLLKPKKGVYSLQITEELWETPYLDQVELMVIDHPDTVDIYIDERFIPPPFPDLHVYTVTQKRFPVSATDEEGNDLLPLIRDKDDRYISNLSPTRYQGITKMHGLILDLGNLSEFKEIILFLNGWVFPTDASINVAVSQSRHVQPVPPYLQVLDRHGRWQTVKETIGFPMGKNKSVIVDLTDSFLTKDYKVRIRTNMQVYWDEIFFSADEPTVPLLMKTLRPMHADIHHRGFSRMYRKNQNGPHWFDYYDVTEEPRWRDLEGYYTRYGDVTPLLMEADDRYVIMNAGDEVSVRFDASLAPEPESGWSRDYLLYTDGWLKDGDLNTAKGKTVAPLPFHGMSSYPYGSDESYPLDAAHQQYRVTYNTRKETPHPFRYALSGVR